MINWSSYPYLLEISWFKVSSHGFFMALGIIIAYFLARKEFTRNKNNNADHFDEMVFYAVLGGVLGSRILYIILHLNTYDSFWDAFKIWEGGLSSFGGIIGGFFTAIIYLKHKKIAWEHLGDVLGPYILLGWGIGRIGDFVLWSEYGTYTNLPWGIVVDNDLARHPTQIYTLIIFTIAFVWLQKLKSKTNKTKGSYFYLSMLIFFSFRFLLEFIMDYPGDQSFINYNLFSHGISLIIAVLSLYKLKIERLVETLTFYI